MGYPNYDAQTGAIFEVRRELERARAKFPRFSSAHEGYAVLQEEVEELKAEVFHGPTRLDPHVMFEPDAAPEQRRKRMREEAVQVAAMALRFIEDVCDAVSASA